jgi:hypothetical protein
VVDVVGEDALAVELDDGEPLAVFGLEGGIAGDFDLDELEGNFGPRLLEDGAGPFAEVATRRGVEDDACR